MSNSEKALVPWNPPLAAMKAALGASRAVVTIAPSHSELAYYSEMVVRDLKKDVELWC